MSLRLRVNPIVCDGHGLCAELLPEMITLDDWGYPIIDPGAIDAGLVGHAHRAVDACPVLALALVPAPTEPAGPTAPLEASSRLGPRSH
jgi:ferredoxin